MSRHQEWRGWPQVVDSKYICYSAFTIQKKISNSRWEFICFNYLRSLSLQIKSRPLSHRKCVIFFLQNHSNCRDVKMGGWASLFSGLSRRIPDSVTQRAVAAYFTGENCEFVGRESLYMANGHLNLNISLMRIPWKILKTWPIDHLNSSKLVMQFGKLCRFSCKFWYFVACQFPYIYCQRG